MTTPRKRKTIGEKIGRQVYPLAIDNMDVEQLESIKAIDRAIAAHTRKVCKPLVDVLKCTSWCNGCSRCKELARTALAKYRASAQKDKS